MAKIEKLEQEVRKLDRAELAAFREWFREYDSDEWDRQIEQDATSGKLDALAKEALAEHKGGGDQRTLSC
ncbi:MAG: hypothetical protein ACRDSJ_12600 [Rubrobacteraceae bacterium]